MEYAVRSRFLPAGWALVAQRDLGPRVLVVPRAKLILVRATGSRGRDLILARRALRAAELLD